MTIDENLEITKAIAKYKENKLKQIDEAQIEDILKQSLRYQVTFCCMDFNTIINDFTKSMKEAV